MHFEFKVTSGGEVRWAGRPYTGPTYYGGPPAETGTWKVDMGRLQAYVEKELREFSFGESVETFVLGFEIADLEGWGKVFTSMHSYTSYRPKMKLVISVGQINWPDVKDLDGPEQFRSLAGVLIQAISRVGEMKRKPKFFDIAPFLMEMRRILDICPVSDMIAEN